MPLGRKFWQTDLDVRWGFELVSRTKFDSVVLEMSTGTSDKEENCLSRARDNKRARKGWRKPKMWILYYVYSI